MSTGLPSHGRVNCTRCFPGQAPAFDKTHRVDGDWRITWNPLAWGSTEPEVVVLGFSKGPTQAGALECSPHDEIAYRGARANVGKILAHIGLIDARPGVSLKERVDQLIADPSGRFHFASLVRCTVTQRVRGETADDAALQWRGTGADMLGGFVATPFGRQVASSCVSRFLGDLPSRTKLVVMFGYGAKRSYVYEARRLYEKARPGSWKWVDEGISYTDGRITVVHVEHFRSQGALIPQWLGERDHPRAGWGLQARKAALGALEC